MTEDNEDRYRNLIEANVADLHAYFLRRLGTQEDAADAVSDVVLTAWRRRSATPPDPSEARLWLFGVAANVLRNTRRSRARQHAVLARLIGDRTAHSTDQSAASTPDAAARLRYAIQSLPEQSAELVRLHHWEGFTLQEVSTILDIPASTVRFRYATTRARLRVLLQDSDEADDPDRRTADFVFRR